MPVWVHENAPGLHELSKTGIRGALRDTPRDTAEPSRSNAKRPHDGALEGGRYKIRTCDPFRVREVRYLCANRPGCVLVWKTYAFLARGGYESRTRLYGFAGRCLTAWLTHRKVVNSSDLRADNGTRTRALDLGKVALYQLSYVRVSSTLLCLKQRVITITTSV